MLWNLPWIRLALVPYRPYLYPAHLGRLHNLGMAASAALLHNPWFLTAQDWCGEQNQNAGWID